MNIFRKIMTFLLAVSLFAGVVPLAACDSSKQEVGNSDSDIVQKPNTEQPGDTQKPNTEQPGDTQKPNTEQPGDTQKPDTEQPGDTQKPNTEQPGDTQKPNTEQPGDTQKPDTEQKPEKVGYKNLAEYVANIGQACAFGISSVAAVPSFAPVLAKNYFVMTTTEYHANRPETDENGLKAVTFTKIETNESFSEIEGSAVYLADAEKYEVHILKQSNGFVEFEADPLHEYRLLYQGTPVSDWIRTDQSVYRYQGPEHHKYSQYQVEARSCNAWLTFPAEEGFEYSVYDGDDCLLQNITDGSSADLEEKAGVIRLAGFLQGKEYEVRYIGHGHEVTITQDEIDGEVDKLLVCENFTLISFVPSGTSLRPADDQSEYDHDGIAVYDKTNYYSDDLRQSYVIDNNSGYVYKIENFRIDRVVNRVIVSKGRPYLMEVQNGDLIFENILPNESVAFFDAFRDGYKNTYIYNNKIDLVDKEKNIVYFTDDYSYIFDEESVIFCTNLKEKTPYNLRFDDHATFYKMKENCTTELLNTEGDGEYSGRLAASYDTIETEIDLVIEDGTGFYRRMGDMDVPDNEARYYSVVFWVFVFENGVVTRNEFFQDRGGIADGWGIVNHRYIWFHDLSGRLYYLDLLELLTTETYLDEERHLLAENINYSVDDCNSLFDMRPELTRDSPTKTEYYLVTLQDGVPTLVYADEVIFEKQVVVFQALNR